jgi:hypothetical protein
MAEPAGDVVRIEPARSRLTIGTDEREMAEISLPGVPRGLALLLLPHGGLTAEAPELMNSLAEHGYESLAVEAGGAGEVVGALLARAREHGWSAEQVGVVGIGEAATTALHAASVFRLGAAVSISLPLTTLAGDPQDDDRLTAAARGMQTPWLCLLGGADPLAPHAAVSSLARAVDELAPVHGVVVSYPAACAGFHCALGDGRAYGASFDAWQRTVEWLNLRVVPRLTPRAQAWRRAHGLAPQLV